MKRITIPLIALLGLFAVWTTTSDAASPQLTAIRLGKHAQQTRVVLAFNQRPKATIFPLKNPDRLVIDLTHTKMKTTLKRPPIKDNTIVRNIRYHQSNKKLRLVIDLAKEITWKTQWLTLKNTGPRLMVDFSKPHIVKKSTQRIQNKKARDIIVVIDPGHGGKDPGAIGYLRTREKNIVLQIAKKLSENINKQPGMRAILTRSRDSYIGLRQRLQIARKYNADFFVAIHADAYKKRQSHGASVYALSERGASSEAARWLASKENYSELGTVDLKNYNDSVLRSVLINLSQTATIGASLEIGNLLLTDLDKIADLHHDKVEQAPFVVLKSPDIPSLLIETGFISNRSEERLLRSSTYQVNIAEALARGIRNYFYQHPPTGSQIATYRKTETHIVKRGDSLSKLAQRYHVSSATLRQYNRLKSDVLRVKQKLFIPQPNTTQQRQPLPQPSV